METKAAESAPPKFELFPSRQFPQWLAESNLSLAFTTYQAGKVIFVGLQPSGRLSIFERTFNRCMGLWSNGQSLWMSTLYQLWRFENVLEPGELHDGYDRVFVPQLAYTTGDLDIHDLALDGAGRPVFVQHRVLLPRHGFGGARASARCGGRHSSPSWRRRIAAI